MQDLKSFSGWNDGTIHWNFRLVSESKMQLNREVAALLICFTGEHLTVCLLFQPVRFWFGVGFGVVLWVFSVCVWFCLSFFWCTCFVWFVVGVCVWFFLIKVGVNGSWWLFIVCLYLEQTTDCARKGLGWYTPQALLKHLYIISAGTIVICDLSLLSKVSFVWSTLWEMGSAVTPSRLRTGAQGELRDQWHRGEMSPLSPGWNHSTHSSQILPVVNLL